MSKSIPLFMAVSLRLLSQLVVILLKFEADHLDWACCVLLKLDTFRHLRRSDDSVCGRQQQIFLRKGTSVQDCVSFGADTGGDHRTHGGDHCMHQRV